MEASSASSILGLDALTLLDALPECAVVFDAEWRVLHLNLAANAFLRERLHHEGELLGKRILTAFPRLSGSELHLAMQELERRRATVELRQPSVLTAGWLEGRLVPTEKGALLLFRDISPQKQLADQLTSLGSELTALVENSPAGILLTTRDGETLAANRRACELLGRTEAELLSLGRQVILPSEGRLDAFQRQLEATGTASAELILRRKDGACFPAQVRAAHFKSAGDTWRTSLLFQDISEQKHTEALNDDARRTLEQTERLFRQTFEEAPFGLALVSLDGRIVRANTRLAEITGLPIDGAAGVSYRQLLGDTDVSVGRELARKLVAGELPHFLHSERITKSDGRVVEVLVHASLLRGDSGEPRFFITQLEDVTEKNALSARVAVADRLVSLGTMAAGVAHEINNPLAYVVANLHLLAEVLEAPPEARDPKLDVKALVEESRQGATRIADVCRTLKSLSRAETERRTPVDVNALLEEALRMAQHQLRHRARLVKALSGAPVVHADPTRLVQVFLNLLLNAAQALPDGQADQHEIKLVSLVDARGVVVEVHDSGPGVPADLRARIFEPFFTTKAVGVGTGLGLALSHATVHALGGTLELDPTVSRGSCFRVTLPPSSEVVRFFPSPPSRRPEEGKVLLIDDDEPLGTSLARVLRLGDRLEVTTRAAEALDRIQRGARYDLILCDVMMPELGGGDFVARLATVAPELVSRVVLMTGGAFTEAQRRFVEQTRLEVLIKPFDVEALRALVAKRLARRS